MKHRRAKAVVCAMAITLLLSGSSYELQAARGVAAFLPAAGLGLTLGDGASIAEVRKEVAQKKAKKAAQPKTNTSERTEETQAAEIFSAEAESESVFAGEPVETESQMPLMEMPKAVSENDADMQEKPIVAPIEPGSPEVEESRAAESDRKETDTTESTESDEAESIETEAGDTDAADDEAADGEAAKDDAAEDTSDSDTDETDADATEAQEKESAGDKGSTEKKEEKDTLVVAQVSDYVNIRSKPGTDGEIVGKLYDNSVGTLLSSKDGWYQIKSGSVEGYVKAEYFEVGDKARKIADEAGEKMAVVDTETLFVRKEPSLEASIIGYVPDQEVLTVLDEENNFVKVSIEEGDGWVSKDYVELDVEYVTAESIEEEKARIEADEKAKEEARKAAEAAEAKLKEEQKKREEEQKRREEEQKAQEAQQEAAQTESVSGNDIEEAADDAGEQEAAQTQESVQQPAAEPESVAVTEEAAETESTQAPQISGSMGSSVADFALQFVGNPYVYGGTSLTNGADCSGFVMSVYKEFGVSLPHSSAADRHVGYKVDSLSEAQPGDLICYSGHVGIYIGGGEIVHASTAKTGIKVSEATYRTPVAIRRIF